PRAAVTLIEPDSREYRILADWIAGGAPGPQSGEPRIERLKLSPPQRTRGVGQTTPLAVTADYNDGSSRDVTWLTQFFANDASVVEVSKAGEVRALRNGETSVRAHFYGQVAVAVMTIPFDQTVDAARFAERSNFIVEHVFNKLAALH